MQCAYRGGGHHNHNACKPTCSRPACQPAWQSDNATCRPLQLRRKKKSTRLTEEIPTGTSHAATCSCCACPAHYPSMASHLEVPDMLWCQSIGAANAHCSARPAPTSGCRQPHVDIAFNLFQTWIEVNNAKTKYCKHKAAPMIHCLPVSSSMTVSKMMDCKAHAQHTFQT